jgi:hypothetical protein
MENQSQGGVLQLPLRVSGGAAWLQLDCFSATCGVLAYVVVHCNSERHAMKGQSMLQSCDGGG